MPTYEYACKSCGRHLDVVQSFKDKPLTKCPHCGGPLRKVFGSIGIAFKGSGFYRTDSRAKSTSSKSGPSKPTETAAKSESSTKAESSKSESSKSESSKSEPSGSTSSSSAASAS